MGGVWLWRIYPRRAGRDSIAGAGRQGQAAASGGSRSAPLTARSRLRRDDGGDGGYTRQSSRMDKRKALGQSGPVDKVGYFKIAAKKMTWKLRKEPLQEWDTSICLT